MQDEQVVGLLKDEYLYTHKAMEDFDGRALTIKAWSITFSAAGLGLAYTQHAPVILLIASFSSLIFWMIEAVWKVHQQPYYERIRVIEMHFRGGPSTEPLQLYRDWVVDFENNGRFKRLRYVLLWPHVMLPHAVIGLAGVILFVFVSPQTDGPEPVSSPVSPAHEARS